MARKSIKTGPVIDGETGAEVKAPAPLAVAETGNKLHIGNVATLTVANMTEAIRDEVVGFERYSRMSAFLAIRIGLRLLWVRDNMHHGALNEVITAMKPEVSRRSLTNYMNVAGRFLLEAKMLDKRTHQLKDAEAIAPILSERLELVAGSDADLTGPIKKLIRWVGDRGLSALYKDLAAENHKPAPPTGRKAQQTEAQRREQAIRDAEAMLESLAQWHEGDTWQLLDDAKLDQLRALGSSFAQKAPAIVRKRNRDQQEGKH